MPKVLISDSLDNIASEILIKNNISVDTKTNLSPEELKKIIDNYDGLIIRSATKVRKDLIDSLSNLKIIGRAGAGVDNVDVEAAKNKNIIVMNTPGGNTNATAEHTIGLIFALQRKITVANETTHKGLWEKKKLKGNEIKGKKIGIVGFGNVGKRVAEISNVLGMHVSIFSSYFETIKDSFPEYNSCSIDEIIKDSDIISFHCKPNKDGNPIMNKNHLSLMKKNCIIINTARGNLVDEDDLKNALEKKEIKGAALDVFKNEPLEESGFYNLDNIILTPHIAASTDEAQIVVAEMVANQFVEFFNNNKIDIVLQAAGKVGGILSNSKYPKDFILDNTLIQTNLIDAAHKTNVKRFLFIGSSCIYPKYCKQPIKEEYFMTGKLEPTNQAMATSKINGIEMCRSYNMQEKNTKYIKNVC